MRPDPATYPAYFNNYIKLVHGENFVEALTNQTPLALNFFRSLSEEHSQYQYADAKWTIKEILQHVIDTERIFSYRALAIAREEKNILPGFDENSYAKHSHANNRQWKELIEEFEAARRGTESLFKSISESDLDKAGKVSDYSISLLALLFVIPGHTTHHINIIKERYFDI